MVHWHTTACIHKGETKTRERERERERERREREEETEKRESRLADPSRVASENQSRSPSVCIALFFVDIHISNFVSPLSLLFLLFPSRLVVYCGVSMRRFAIFSRKSITTTKTILANFFLEIRQTQSFHFLALQRHVLFLSFSFSSFSEKTEARERGEEEERRGETGGREGFRYPERRLRQIAKGPQSWSLSEVLSLCSLLSLSLSLSVCCVCVWSLPGFFFAIFFSAPLSKFEIPNRKGQEDRKDQAFWLRYQVLVRGFRNMRIKWLRLHHVSADGIAKGKGGFQTASTIFALYYWKSKFSVFFFLQGNVLTDERIVCGGGGPFSQAFSSFSEPNIETGEKHNKMTRRERSDQQHYDILSLLSLSLSLSL